MLSGGHVTEAGDIERWIQEGTACCWQDSLVLARQLGVGKTAWCWQDSLVLARQLGVGKIQVG